MRGSEAERTQPTLVHSDLLEVPVEDLRASLHVRLGDVHLHVEPARTDQRTAGGGDHKQPSGCVYSEAYRGLEADSPHIIT